MVDVAENGVNVYLVNKHYEVAPVLSMTEHEANNSLHLDQRQAVAQPDAGAARLGAGGGRRGQPRISRRGRSTLEHQSAEKLKTMGVKVVTDVDKSGFIKLAQPYLEKLAKELGPHAAKIQQLISAVK